jgi:transposase InsO family protein
MAITDVDQLWVADITYIRFREEVVYLAVILDACSRRVIGWAMERTLEDKLTLTPLRMTPAALKTRNRRHLKLWILISLDRVRELRLWMRRRSKSAATQHR